MEPQEFVQSLEQLLGEFKDSLKKPTPALPGNALEMAETAYEAVRDARNHAREMASRILTTMAFFTAAATALYVAIYSHNPGESTERLELAKIGITVYLVATLTGSLFYLSTLWPPGPAWSKHPKDDTYAFSLRYFNAKLKFASTNELRGQKVSDVEELLITDFLRERDNASKSAYSVGRQLQVGSFLFIIAFLGILLLVAAHLYSTRKEGLLAFTVMSGVMTALGAFGAWLRTWGESTGTRGGWVAAWGGLGTVLSIVGYLWVQANL